MLWVPTLLGKVPVYESDVPYQDDNGGKDKDANWTVNETYRTASEAHCKNAEIFPSPANWTTGEYVYDAKAVEQIKESIYNNGAVSAFLLCISAYK